MRKVSKADRGTGERCAGSQRTPTRVGKSVSAHCSPCDFEVHAAWTKGLITSRFCAVVLVIRLEQERSQNCFMKKQIEELEGERLCIQEECKQLRHQQSSPAELEKAKSSVRELSQQVVALKWQMLDVMRRAELAEAHCARQGIALSFQ